MRATLAAGALIAALAAQGSGTAHADDKAKAIALFDEGRKEMKAGNHAKACRAFEASMRLVPDSGTRGSLARCYTALGRVASAWTLWRELADTAPPALRADAAAEARQLEPRLPRYRVKLAAPAPGLAVTVAGAPADVTLDVAVPIDPGTYEVEATAPGREPWRGEITATEGQTVVIEVPELEPPARAGEPRPPRSSRRPEARDPGRGRRILGLVIAGAGIGGLATGGVFGAIARARNDDAVSLCGGAIDRCDPARTNDAQAKVDDARSAASIATIAAIAGGAALVTGVVLYVTAPERERAIAVTPVVGGGLAGVALSGRY